jgi:hypothetical protein
MAYEEAERILAGYDPIPAFPQIQSADLGEGEYSDFLKILSF